MAHRRSDVVACALSVLDRYGLSDLTMRRLAAELQVRPSALYHHFGNKQQLLAAVADEVLERGHRTRSATGWAQQVVEVCGELRDAMLAYRDGAELVATVHAFGLGARRPADELAAVLDRADLDPDTARVAARTLLHYVFGHTGEEQTHLQAASVGAIGDELDSDSDFDLGLALLLDGIRVHRVGSRRGASAVVQASSRRAAGRGSPA